MDAINKLLEHDTAGDPVSGLKWCRKTTQKIAAQLKSLGIDVGRTTVGKLLKRMKYSLKTNQKNIGAGKDPDRNAQFEYISRQRKQAPGEGTPVISVDTKKKEKVGPFKNSGATWRQEARQVNDHDFRSMAKGMAVPYGIYDEQANRGFLCVGTSYDTPEFAVDCIVKWWRDEGGKRYPDASEVLILADGGGSNGFRPRLWKSALQEKLCDRFGLSVTVAHYPPGTSKWNPIEHRLFSEISKNWAGEPLDSYETILKFIRTTTTTTGLKVRSRLVSKQYQKGIAVSDERMETLNIARHDILPKWNYTLSPIENSA
jgi:hypothetical protein